MKPFRWVTFLPLLLLANVFIVSGVSKAIHPAAFQERILDYRLVGHAVASGLAAWLPWLEIVCGTAVLVPALRRGALLLLAGLLVLFIGALNSALIRSLGIHCGCFGDRGHGLWLALLADVAFLSITLLGLRFDRMPTRSHPAISIPDPGDHHPTARIS